MTYSSLHNKTTYEVGFFFQFAIVMLQWQTFPQEMLTEMTSL